MGLKITKSSDPIKVDRLTICLYGQPGVGKTSLAYTSDSPLLLDFDGGAYRAANRRDTVQVHRWADVTEITADDLAPYKTVIVDTAGRALDQLGADIIRRNAKMGRGGALTLQGYGALKAEFIAWLKLVNSFGKDVILIAHMDEQRNGDEVLERLDVQGGSKNEIYKAADAMGRIFIRGNKRELDFTPRENSFGKNPGQLDVLTVPVDDAGFMAGVVGQIKERLNALTEEQREAQAVIESWRERIETMADVDAFNAALGDVRQAPKVCQAMFSQAAKGHGFEFDKAVGAYAMPVGA
ncbi:ATP-binding protein [Castellaniella caeni]|uniref:ATP-binding protein n=1 Tax=Castellaniella caeni TaxID=266123 RepID=UPI000C9F54A8|nr:ATP-binding protein [Castellaniella caeni]